MSDQMKPTSPRDGIAPRRAFFGRLAAAVGGGIMGGAFLQRLFGSRGSAAPQERSVSVAIHPMAVPRSKEGSESHV